MSDTERWDGDRSRRRSAWAALMVAASSQFLYMLDSGLVAISLPEIEGRFHASRVTLGWVAGAFMVAQSSLLLVGGRFGDRYGRKRSFLTGLAVFSLGAVGTAVAPTIWLLIAARVVQGVGAAFLTSGALALVLPMFPTAKSATVIGAWGVVGTIGALVTPVLGPFLVERSWRLAFFLVAPIGATAIVLGRRLLHEQPIDTSAGRPDRIGYLVGPPALGGAVLVVSRGSQWGWTSLPTVGLALGSAGLLAVLFRRSAVASAPLLDLDILRHRWFSVNLGAGVLQQVGFFAWWLTAPLVMRQLWNWSVRDIGLALAATQVPALFSAPLGGRMVQRFGASVPIVTGAVVIVASQIWLLVTAGREADVAMSYLPMALAFGFGCGMSGTVTTGAALASLPQSLLGTANSIVQLARRFGGALGVAVGIAVLGEASGDAILSGARRVWLLVAILHLAMVVPIFLGHRRIRETPTP